jgi:hypothetical protein
VAAVPKVPPRKLKKKTLLCVKSYCTATGMLRNMRQFFFLSLTSMNYFFFDFEVLTAKYMRNMISYVFAPHNLVEVH